MERELISIIVPAFNVESYVKNTIDSILAQTYSNIEIICVDDGSTDNTRKELKRLAAIDSRVKVFTKINEGVTKAREFGFNNANGEYIGFVDADDTIEPTMYEQLYQNMKEYNADISHCGHDIVWLDGKKEFFYNTGRLAQQDKISGIKSLISGSFEPGLCNKLYKYTLLHSLLHSGVLDFSIKMNEDLLMNYYLFKEADCSVLEDVCLYHYTKREGSATSSGFKKSNQWDSIKVKQIIYNDSVGTDYEKNAKIAFLQRCFNSYNVFLEQKSSEYESDKQRIRNIVKKYKNDLRFMKKKYRLLVRLLILSPSIYKMVYRIFS